MKDSPSHPFGGEQAHTKDDIGQLPNGRKCQKSLEVVLGKGNERGDNDRKGCNDADNKTKV